MFACLEAGVGTGWERHSCRCELGHHQQPRLSNPPVACGRIPDRLVGGNLIFFGDQRHSGFPLLKFALWRSANFATVVTLAKKRSFWRARVEISKPNRPERRHSCPDTSLSRALPRARHRHGYRAVSGGDGRSADGGQRTGCGVDCVPGYEGASGTQHIGEVTCGVHRHACRAPPAAKGDPLTGVSAPVVGLIVYP